MANKCWTTMFVAVRSLKISVFSLMRAETYVPTQEGFLFFRRQGLVLSALPPVDSTAPSSSRPHLVIVIDACPDKNRVPEVCFGLPVHAQLLRLFVTAVPEVRGSIPAVNNTMP